MTQLCQPCPGIESVNYVLASRPDADIDIDTLASELAVLAAAQRADEEGRTGEALELLGEHARTHGDGVMSAERDGARLLMMCRSAHPGASSAYRAFVRRYSASPMMEEVRRSCRDIISPQESNNDASAEDDLTPTH